MKRLARYVVLAEGRRRAILAFLAGAVGAAAMPPLGFLPALIVTMTVAVWLLDGCGAQTAGGLLWARVKSAAAPGWWLGFGYFVAGLYWLGAAMLVEPDKFAWAIPLAVLGLPALLACFTAAGFVLAAALWRPGNRRIFALAFGLGASEVARGTLLTGFPWNDFGMALGQYPLLAQSASIYGLYGLTAITIAICASPATLADDPAKGRRAGFLVVTCCAVFAAITAFGAIRLKFGTVEMVPDVNIRIMQPNLPQDAKFKPSAGPEILRRYLELSDRATSPTIAGLTNVTHLIWPESAFPFVLSREPQALNMIAAALGGHTTLLTGAIRIEGESSSRAKAFNALQAIDGQGRILDSEDKVHLVPFGEYIPAGGILRRLGLTDAISLPGGFSAGSYRRAMNVPGLPPFQPLICYEAIFPGEVTPAEDGSGRTVRPGFLLNVTNDGWFGMTSGPYQHFAQARLRTIEEGLPLVRAANTGVSAVVDPYGRVVKYLPLGVAGVLDSHLPKPIPATIFSRRPILPAALVFVLCLAGAFARRRRP